MERKYKVIDYNTLEVNGIRIKRVDELPADNVEVGSMKDDYGVYSKIAAKENAVYSKRNVFHWTEGWYLQPFKPYYVKAHVKWFSNQNNLDLILYVDESGFKGGYCGDIAEYVQYWIVEIIEH